jgi:fibronectin type 3 domain-containing protein
MAEAESSSSIRVSWNAVSGAESYEVYYEIGESTTKILADSVSGHSYNHTGLQPDMTYWYYIKAVNSAGKSGYSSSNAYAATKSGSSSGYAPDAPTGVAALAQSSSSIRVTWNAVSGADEYYVYRALSASGIYSRVGESTLISYNSTSYTDEELNASTTYYYKVTAVNDYGESAKSSYATAITESGSSSGPPVAPTVTVSSQYSQNISLSWGAVTGAASYKVYRGTGASLTSLITTISTTSHTDTVPAAGLYYYQVSAVSSTGSEGNKSTAKFAVGASVTALSAVSSASSPVTSYSISGSSKYFKMTAFGSYQIRWKDYDITSSLADIKVTAYDNDGTLLFGPTDDVSNGFYCFDNFTVTGGKDVVILVEPLTTNPSGTFYMNYY